MRTTLLLLIPIMLVLLMACDENGIIKTDTDLSDDDMILAIQNATNKVVVDISEMPGNSRSVIDEDYVEYETLEALRAPELGYEVSLGGRGDRTGRHCSAYFDLDGREFRAGGDREGGRHEGGDRDAECFELVLPVTFLMPDGSTITVENEDDYAGVRAWYEANPDAEGHPELQFPVDIVYDDGTTATINNAEEMQSAYGDCGGEGDRPPGDWGRP